MDLRDQLQSSLGAAYTIERELGGGGMSRVFLATETALGRQVVIKVLPPETAGEVSIERFRREISLASRLQQAHIVPVLAAGEAGGLPYYTMPFVEGESLRARLGREGEFPIDEAVGILKEVARALMYAHEHGVVHRDIKPDNVLLSGGSAMVTDFGVAKALSASTRPATTGLTSQGVSLGTPTYMSPEQVSADPMTDHRSDLYAFGVMAYEMLSGQPPFAGRPTLATLAAHVNETPEPLANRRPSVPAPLATLITRCLEKRPADRPQSAGEIVRTLDTIVTSSDALRPAVGARADAPSKPLWQLRRVWIGAGIATAAILAFALRGRLASGATDSTISVAVLPFANMSASAEDEYFSDGLTEELTTALAKAGLRVAPRSSAFSYKGKTVNVKDVGKALNVSTVMEGTVRRAGNRLRLTATLSATSDGLTLWSESYEKEVKDVFQVQDEVATAMVSALKVHLAAGQTVAGAKGRGTQDPEAYDLYLRGRFQVRKRGEPALRQAAILFQQAIDRDPKFARAYAGLGDAIGLLPFWSNAPVDSAAPLALAAIDRATTLEPTLVEAHATRGLVLELQYQWNEAERAFRRTIELDPQYASAYQWLGEFLLSVGREDEAVATIHKAIELDPLSPAAWNAYVIALTVAGQDSAAIAAGRRELEIDPNLPVIHHDIAAAYAKSGRWMEALREEEQVADDQRNHLIRAIYLGKNGRRREAQEILRRAEESAVHVRGTAADIARLAFGLDDVEKAMGWFIRSAEAHETFWANDPDLRPYFDRLRSHQRFPELLRKTNLETQPVAKPRSAAR